MFGLNKEKEQVDRVDHVKHSKHFKKAWLATTFLFFLFLILKTLDIVISCNSIFIIISYMLFDDFCWHVAKHFINVFSCLGRCSIEFGINGRGKFLRSSTISRWKEIDFIANDKYGYYSVNYKDNKLSIPSLSAL